MIILYFVLEIMYDKPKMERFAHECLQADDAFPLRMETKAALCRTERTFLSRAFHPELLLPQQSRQRLAKSGPTPTCVSTRLSPPMWIVR